MISREEAPLKECFNFTRYFGGSPANVLVNMQRLENKTAFISRVGEDEFGEYLTEILENEGVNLDCLQSDQEAGTLIIFVNKSKETPSWLAYRGADIIKPSLDDAYHLYGQDHPENYLKKYHSDGAGLGNALAAFKIQGVGALASVPPLMEIISYYDIQPIEGGNFNE